MARKIGNEKALRAVGQANGKTSGPHCALPSNRGQQWIPDRIFSRGGIDLKASFCGMRAYP